MMEGNITSLVFYSFCMGVPMFMAFNGGATAATVDTIQKEGDWTATGLGLLGAMDKIGMTLSAAFWGYLLQQVPTKTLLVLGLGVNSVSILMFGLLKNWMAMLLAKLLIGFTEGLQWVWAPLWIVKFADEESLSLWMNLSGGLAAGIGSGLGTIVAGFTTAQGMSYSFAFTCEGCVLGMFLLELLLVPSEKLSIGADDPSWMSRRPPMHRASSTSSDGSGGSVAVSVNSLPYGRLGSHSVDVVFDEEAPPLSQQLRSLWDNPLFVRTALAYSSANFVTAGLQFMWIRLFISLWPLHKYAAVLSFLLILGIGGAVGVAIGSSRQVSSEVNCRGPALLFIRKAYMYASCGAGLFLCVLMLQLQSQRVSMLELQSQRGVSSSALLMLSWISIFAVVVGVGSTPGLLQIVCTNSVESLSQRSLATGLSQSVNNFLGFALGPLLPQVVIDLLHQNIDMSGPDTLVAAVGTIMGGVVFGWVLCGLALRAAKLGQRDQSSSMELEAIAENE